MKDVTLNDVLLHLRAIVKRANCRELPTVTLEFGTHADRWDFVMTARKDITPFDLESCMRALNGGFDLVGIKVLTRVRGEPTC